MFSPRAPTVLLAASAALAAPLSAQCLLDRTVASDAAQSDLYGSAMAAWGRFVVTGAEYADVDLGSFDLGQVYVLERVGDQWIENAALSHSDAEFDDRFGHATSIWEHRLVGGARYNADFGYATGSAYVFEYDGATWHETAKLVPSDASLGDFFGGAVGVFGDRILVGAHGDDPNGVEKAGSVYAFDYDGTQWVEAQRITVSKPAANARFGEHIAMWEDRAIVGAIGDDELGSKAGAAYVFEVGADGQWFEAAKLLAPDGVDFDRFGTEVAIHGDVAVVGAGLAGELFEGAVYLYERDAAGGWSFVQKLEAPGGLVGENFGHDVSIWGDVVLATSQSLAQGGLNAVGVVWVYRRQGDGSFAHEDTLRPKEAQFGLQFGNSSAIFRDLIAVGARGSELAAGYQSGEVYLFGGTGTTTEHLDGCPGELSVRAGGTQAFELWGGDANAGLPYLVVGSATGTDAGPIVDGLEIPLTPDAYTALTLDPALTPVVHGYGLLDGQGRASASVTLAPQSDAALIGLTVRHAFVVVDPLDLSLSLVSAPVDVLLAP